jgi:hypothetical protein
MEKALAEHIAAPKTRAARLTTSTGYCGRSLSVTPIPSVGTVGWIGNFPTVPTGRRASILAVRYLRNSI